MSERRLSLVGALASASCTLLSGTPARAVPLDVEAATLVFSEFEQVSGTEVNLRARAPLSAQSSLTLGVVLDVLVGASANGATPSTRAQTFTRPSGFGGYSAAPREAPLDPSFQDNRLEFSAAWDRRMSRTLSASFASRLSLEFDYMSVGAETRWRLDNDSRDTGWLIGLSATHDRVHTVGGIPIPLASMAPVGAAQPRADAARTKNVFDVLLGVTRVLGRRSVAQLNYTLGNSDGYHNDPYKLVSVVDAGSGATLDYRYEARPEQRRVQSLYARLKHRLPENVLDLAWRASSDDWGVRAHTVDVGYRIRRGASAYWEPHLRLYTQSAADFYRHSVTDAAPLPVSLSADRRLAAFDALTVGLRWGETGARGDRRSMSLAWYQQFGDDHPADAVGEQRGLDLFTETRALMFQYHRAFTW